MVEIDTVEKFESDMQELRALADQLFERATLEELQVVAKNTFGFETHPVTRSSEDDKPKSE